MIDLYSWTTGNGRKVAIALEEMGLAYEAHPIDLTKGEQFGEEFARISPNHKIPAISDRNTGLSLFESGAILLYLAEKTGQFMPKDEAGKWTAMQWLMWQMGGVGPMFGQAMHFLHYSPGKSDYAAERYGTEARRLYAVLDKQLAQKRHVAGEDYSIVDMAIWPWISRHPFQKIDLNDFENVRRWYVDIAARPAVLCAWQVFGDKAAIPMP